jgi:ABC-2 type transport system ATP-binding protein
VIEIRELYKYYGDRRAIGPLSATIEKGEIVGLLGLNGAGKTTTLRILACDLLPTSGSVRVEGIDVVERPDDVRAKIGYLPETPPLYADMTVTEYLSFVARLRGVARGDVARRVSDAIELTEVRDERDQVIGSLSHGYRQRVGIAQAIVHQPRLVVLDEPISGLDPVQIVEMRDLVKNLGGEHTVVVSSHILSEISETCDRILVIREGMIVASGTESELSAKVLRGMQIDLTVRVQGGGPYRDSLGRIQTLLSEIPGVSRADEVEPSEAGDQVASFRVYASSDVRDALCRSLVEKGVGVLGLARSERELERVFAELSRVEGEDVGKRQRRKRALQKPEAPAPAAATEEKSSTVSDGVASAEEGQ